jgi:nucleotide-binding universal stress UspA family protein
MIRDIVVHLTGSDEDKIRLDYAENLAMYFDAHLTGLLTHIDPEVLGAPELAYSGVLEELIRQANDLTKERQDALRPRFSKMAMPNDLRVVSGYRGNVGQAMAAEARTADLFVGTRPFGDRDNNHRIEEQVLFMGAGPCLLLPPSYPSRILYDTIVVGWKDSREAARAVKDALPFLRKAQTVILAMVHEEADEETRSSSGADVGRFLSRHGIKAEIKVITGRRHASEALLDEAEARLANLIVAGGYGRSRLSEWLLGGVTRSLLSECPIPVLMSR